MKDNTSTTLSIMKEDNLSITIPMKEKGSNKLSEFKNKSQIHERVQKFKLRHL